MHPIDIDKLHLIVLWSLRKRVTPDEKLKLAKEEAINLERALTRMPAHDQQAMRAILYESFASLCYMLRRVYEEEHRKPHDVASSRL